MTFTILLAHAAAAWFMTGLIWFVQVAHYPLFDRMGSDESARYCVDIRRLVVSNWLRTILWTARGLLALWLIAVH